MALVNPACSQAVLGLFKEGTVLGTWRWVTLPGIDKGFRSRRMGGRGTDGAGSVVRLDLKWEGQAGQSTYL